MSSGPYSTITEAVTLTNAYVSSTKSIDISGCTQMIVTATYTPAANARNCSIKVQFSYDGGATWGTEVIGADGTPTSGEVVTTLYERVYTIPGATLGTAYVRRIPIGVADNGPKGVLVRELHKEDGAGTHGTLSVSISGYEESKN